MTKQVKTKLNAEFKSILISFITAFAIAIAPLIDSISLENVKEGALAGILWAGVRAGVKALIDFVAQKAVK